MKHLILSTILFLGLTVTAQTAYTEFTMPNTLNTKKCTYGTDSTGAIHYLVELGTGNVYMLWVQSSQIFNPPVFPPNFSMFTGYYPTAKTWTFDPVNGWLVMNDTNNNTWIRQH